MVGAGKSTGYLTAPLSRQLGSQIIRLNLEFGQRAFALLCNIASVPGRRQ